jgi:hypothetical protein
MTQRLSRTVITEVKEVLSLVLDRILVSTNRELVTRRLVAISPRKIESKSWFLRHYY